MSMAAMVQVMGLVSRLPFGSLLHHSSFSPLDRSPFAAAASLIAAEGVVPSVRDTKARPFHSVLIVLRFLTTSCFGYSFFPDVIISRTF